MSFEISFDESDSVSIGLLVATGILAGIMSFIAFKIHQIRSIVKNDGSSSSPEVNAAQIACQHSSHDAKALENEKMSSAQAALRKYAEKIEIDFKEIEIFEQMNENNIGLTFKAKWRGSTVNIIQLKCDISKSVLEQELSLLIKSRHPSLVIFMGFCFHSISKRYCLMTQHMSRGTLYDILHDSQLTLNWRQRLAMLIDIAKGLLFLHNSNVVHTDFKSTIILLDEEWQAKISQFGLPTIRQQAQTAAASDSPLWAAPEVILSNKTSKESDIYSFGIIIWEMLTRVVPYGELSSCPVKLVRDIVNNGLRPSIPAACPAPLTSILQKCWHVEPLKRPSLNEVIDCLISVANVHVDVNDLSPDLVVRVDRGLTMKQLPMWAIKFEELQIEKLIGRGSFGDVYLGLFRGQKVAVKKLSGIASESALKDFVDELILMSEMRHPNIVLFMAACLTPPNVCIVMEYCERGNLYDLLHDKSSHLDYNLIMRYLEETAQAITYLHGFKKPVLHCDLKSMNILLASDGSVKVSDFGVAKVKNNFKGDSNLKLGTPLWMSPESMESQVFTEASDCYSFGVVIWEMFLRKDPFFGVNPIKAAMLVLTEDVRPSIPSYIPQETAKLISDCWQRNPKLRPSFTEILERLQKIKEKGIPRITLSRANALLYRKGILVDAFRSKDQITVFKSWGSGESKPGDWVIVGPNNDVYTCDRHIFESTYRPERDKERVYRKVGTIWAKKMTEAFLVTTLEGMEHGEAGDYLVQNAVDGEQWPIDQVTFDKTYEQAPSQASHINIEEEFKTNLTLATESNAPSQISTARTHVTNLSNLY